MEIIERIQSLSKKEIGDTKIFNDPIAKETSWEPLEEGGSSFRTRELISVNSNRVAFKNTLLVKILPWIFSVMPVFALGEIYTKILNGNFQLDNNIIFLILFFIVLPIIISFIIYRAINFFVIFDKRYGRFWKRKPGDRKLITDYVRFEDIYALQLISEYVRSSSGSSGSSIFYSYELNLVLKDASRINVVEHGGRRAMIKDAEKLSDFLKIPLWNAI